MTSYEAEASVKEMNSIAINERLKETLLRAMDETVSAQYGLHMRDVLHLSLLIVSSARNDGVNESVETLMPVLEENFGSHAGSLSQAIGKRMFLHLQLDFPDSSQFSLRNCVNDARAALMEKQNGKGVP